MNLRDCAIFASLPPKDAEELDAVSIVRRFRDGEFLFFEGDPSDRFIVITGGRVKIIKQSPTGKEVILEILGVGDPVGAVAVLDGVPFPASAQAMGPVGVLVIARDRFLPVADRNPALSRDLFRFMRERLRAARQAVPSLSRDPVEQRIALTLLRFADQEGSRDRDRITLSMALTRTDIAKMVDSAVETVIRIMSRWEKDGLIRSARGRPLVLLNPQKLRDIAGS